MLINHASKQVTAKIVYYGPGLSGKTTNLQYIFSVTNPRSRGELISMETEIERTLFFDLLPINVGLIKGYQTRFQLYTVPGQVFYDSTRKLVLKGADGIVFVADSQELMEQTNLESFENLQENLAQYKKKLDDMPLVLQYNKRDLKTISPLEKLNELLNGRQRPYFEAVAKSGRGVLETLREISQQTLVKIHDALEQGEKAPPAEPVRFDTDSGHAPVRREQLPTRKITVEKIEEASLHQAPLQEEPRPAPPAPPPATAPSAPAREAPPPEPRPAGRPERKPAPEIKDDFLNRFEDASRLTRIERVTVSGDHLDLQLRDGSAGLIREMRIDLKPETKKITLILDVKR